MRVLKEPDGRGTAKENYTIQINIYTKQMEKIEYCNVGHAIEKREI